MVTKPAVPALRDTSRNIDLSIIEMVAGSLRRQPSARNLGETRANAALAINPQL
jgi:hypothetical protein